MAENKEDIVEKFKAHMREEFAKIPKNLSEEELIDRSSRCLSLADTLMSQGEKMKAKHYELLSQKYKQLAHEKKNPKPKQAPVAQTPVVEEKPVEEKKQGFFKRLFSKKKKTEVKN